jgi:hypothetical protein
MLFGPRQAEALIYCRLGWARTYSQASRRRQGDVRQALFWIGTFATDRTVA